MATIRTGTGTDHSDGSKYRWAQTDRWRIVYWPEFGGVECQRAWIGGWYLDTHDEMPPGAYQALAESIGAPDLAEI